MDLVDLIESKRFLGHEFLLWLWFEADRGGGVFGLGDAGEVSVAFDDQLVLEAYLAETEQSRLSGGAPAESPEARSALRAGKRVSKAKLRLRRGDREFVFAVDAADFSFASVRVPAVLKGEDERLVERLALIDELMELWRALYREFLRLRLTDRWQATRRSLLVWAQGQAPGAAGGPR